MFSTKKMIAALFKEKSSFAEWVREGNDCYKCPCLWEDVGFEDSDCGCFAGRDYFEETCRLPLIVRKYLKRRAEFFLDHEYDGIGEWYEEDQRIHEAAKKAVYESYRDHLVFCWKIKNDDETYSFAEYNQEAILDSMCYDIRRAVESELRKGKPHNLKEEWAAIIKKTAKDGIFKIRSILTV